MTVPRHPMPRHHSPFYRTVLHSSRALHTYVSMLMLILFVFFASTGFMLNHPTWFRLDDTRTRESDLAVPANILASKDKLMLVEFFRAQGVTGAVQQFDWPEPGDPFHLSFKAPGAESDVDINLPSGESHLTIQTRGVAGLVTRLHTAKDAGPAWRRLLDATALLLLFVCITGVILWQSLPKRRKLGAAALVLSVLTIVIAYAMCVP